MAPKSKNQEDAVPHVSGQCNEPMSRPAHALSYHQLVEELRAHTLNGLDDSDANTRLEKYGKNELGEVEGVQPIKIIIAQIANAMTLV